MKLLRLAVLATALLCGACDRGPRIAPLNDDAVIVAFGDSLTRGVGADGGHAYPDHLQNSIGITVINEGISGEITAVGLARLPGVLDTHNPRLVILFHGGNDILRKLPRTGTRENLQAMIDTILRHGSDVILIGVPEFNFFTDTAPIYRELATDNALPAQLDIVGRLERKPRYKSDGVHFNNEGYAELARAIQDLMDDAGAL
ncbi:MAG: GDSL-type esterase/lipase family protein [Pseudomonadota bacterium]|nr:GDSL-type esterase/lipase family protein [Pseudomonadota bacterium]